MTIGKFDKIIDSRDVIARIAELEEEREAYAEEVATAQDAVNDLDEETPDAGEAEALRDALAALSVWDEDNGDELHALKSLADEAANYSRDWRHGETLIHGDYFIQYIEELLQDIYDLPRKLPDYLVIDWEATAKNIEHDYTSVDFDGEEYLIRSC
jgi:hypothetical protein